MTTSAFSEGVGNWTLSAKLLDSNYNALHVEICNIVYVRKCNVYHDKNKVFVTKYSIIKLDVF